MRPVSSDELHDEPAREIAERVLSFTVSGEIRGYLTRKVKKLWPSVVMLDSRK